jgi:VanZ family protein
MSPFQTVTAAAAIISMAFIAYATLSPLNEGQEFVDTGLFSHLDHYLAFAIVSGLLSLAYPRQTFLVCILVFGSAVLLELAQMLTPDRHARVIDAARKVIGGTIGIAFARLAISLYSRRTTPRDQDR